VAHGMSKPAGLPDMTNPDLPMLALDDDDPRFNHDGVHVIHRGIRRVLNDHPDAVAIGEIWVFDNEDFAKYLRPDELHLGFNFRLVRAEFDAVEIREAIENSLAAADLAGSPPTWTLSNHDVEREVSRYGDGATGLARARAIALVMLALPGAVFVYNGEELGLPNVDLPDDVLQDPVWERSGREERGRDGCRVPMPWSGDSPPFGFSDTADTWLPMPSDWSGLTVEAQDGVDDSTLSLFRRAIELRHGRGDLGEGIEWQEAPDGVLAFRGADGVVCVLNAGTSPVPLPEGTVLIASAAVDGALSPGAAAWIG
jgi:alpha-glucosidase